MDFLKAFGKYLLTMVIVFVALGIVVRIFYVDIVTVGDNSMAPTLLAGERVIVWRLAELEVGDVALCEKPVRSGVQQFMISRVVAHTGHQIAVENGVLNVSGRKAQSVLQERLRFYNTTASRDELPWRAREDLHGHEHDMFVTRVPPFSMRPVGSINGFFMLGDNRTQSTLDSRALGTVSPNRCRGRVVLRWSVAPPSGHDDDVYGTHEAFDRIR